MKTENIIRNEARLLHDCRQQSKPTQKAPAENEVNFGVWLNIHTIKLIPREARAEGPSVARLINLSGRRPRSEAKPCEFEPNIYLYICLYVSVKVSVLLPGNSAQTKYE